jgi:signal recognition particle receptor subunit beta
MAFFNYSTMQMTAKIVYYGPGLCGKTTNLQFIYDHTTNDSRGEMVSLETQTDRTLFFDLLPMEVGSIAGFKTRIQLYTVPGQVFYNTTRKLVLKGVDGVVFVADSQRPMMSANRESLDNLAENLSSLGLGIDTVPLVLQFNKRDLPDTASVDELRELLHRNSWPMFEASAITGKGVVETLRGISKLTLLSLRKQLEASGAGQLPQRAPAAAPAAVPAAAPAATGPAPRVPTAVPPPAPALASAPVPAPAPAAPKPTPVEVRRDLRLDLGSASGRARRVRVGLRLEDAAQRVLGRLEGLEIELDTPATVDGLKFQVDVTLDPES